MTHDDRLKMREALKDAALHPDIVANRMEVAAFASAAFRDVGEKLHAFGHMLGTDRRDNLSPFGHGDDAAVAVSILLRIGSQLISGSADLIADGRHYAGSALIRQLVEIEYLAWAFETKNEEAARWLRSTKEERFSFTPAKLRKSSDGRFRSEDYGHHCELGGHPVPRSWMLLNNDTATAQLMLSDCIGHAERVWLHIVGWADGYTLGEIVLSRASDMAVRFAEWKRTDPLTILPPPPA